ncbi:MAG: hypothetical protein OHK0011_01230 [Turneriella sp.]
MHVNWKHHRHYIFLDLEATCAKDNGFARTERETIEIGAVALDAAAVLLPRLGAARLSQPVTG